jgi:hypothetical protein
MLVCVGITGCNQGTKSASENHIQWDSIHIEKTYHLLDDPNNPNCNIQVHFVFPVKLNNSAALTKVQQYIVHSCFGESYDSLPPAEAAAHYTEQYLNSYKELEKDFLEEKEHNHEDEATATAWLSYYEFFYNEILYSKNDLLCYTVFYENYTGGAHGSHSGTCHILDLNTGEALGEKDFFVEGYQEELAAMLVSKIAETNRLKDPKELENMGFFSIDEIYPNGNLTIDDNGITYYFNEYEIAAYVVGITKVFLPYSEIKHLLRSDSPIAVPAGL